MRFVARTGASEERIPSLVQSAATTESASQKIHLIAEDAAVREYQVFGPVRYERHGEQWHAGLLGCTRPLGVIARSARGDNIAPGIRPAARQRSYMIPGQHVLGEGLAAVEAQMSITSKQFTVRQSRHASLTFGMSCAALDGDDRADGERGTRTATTIQAAMEGELGGAGGPRDQLARAEANGMLPADPANRMPGNVQSENQCSQFRSLRSAHHARATIANGFIFHEQNRDATPVSVDAPASCPLFASLCC